MMASPDGRRLFLDPGDLFFGGGPRQLETLLGSCVAVTLWHPQRHLGGLCHVMLPQRPHPDGAPDHRYADEAVRSFISQLAAHHTQPQEYQVGLFGGGIMSDSPREAIGARNIACTRALLQRHGFAVSREDVGGPVYRRLSLDLASGAIRLQCRPMAAQGVDRP